MGSPKKITVMVPLTYWQCHVPEHHHKTVEIAQTCMDRRLGGKTTVRWTVENLELIKQQRETGLTFREIGQKWNISLSRAAQVVQSYDHYIRRAVARSHASF